MPTATNAGRDDAAPGRLQRALADLRRRSRGCRIARRQRLRHGTAQRWPRHRSATRHRRTSPGGACRGNARRRRTCRCRQGDADGRWPLNAKTIATRARNVHGAGRSAARWRHSKRSIIQDLGYICARADTAWRAADAFVVLVIAGNVTVAALAVAVLLRASVTSAVDVDLEAASTFGAAGPDLRDCCREVHRSGPCIARIKSRRG